MNNFYIVAPHTGAWIEIMLDNFCEKIFKVAPHTGAWIEITTIGSLDVNPLSPLIQGRGLKSLSSAFILKAVRVAPHTGAWIEII